MIQYIFFQKMSLQIPQFLRVFEKGIELEHENIDPLTHSLPPIRYTLNNSVVQLLQKIRDSLSMMAAIGFSSSFFKIVRKMMLLDILSEDNASKQGNFSDNQLYLSSKIEIIPSQPAQWIYGEVRLRKEENDGSLSPIRLNTKDLLEQKIGISILGTILASSVLIIEAADSQSLHQILKLFKQTQQKISDLPNAFPKVYVVLTSNKFNQSDLQNQILKMRNRNITIELIANESKQGWEEEYRLISIGKTIIGNLKPKVIGKVSITSKLLSFLWFSLANSGDTIAPLSVWQAAQDQLVQQHSEQALQQYMSRIDDITEGQEFLSQSFFRDAQMKVRSDVLKQVAERAGFTLESQNILKTERRLLQWKDELESRNSRGVQEWGKEFVKEAWNIIEKKIGKEIKSIFGLRQQIQILFEFFKKKSQVFISSELVMNFIEFLLPKIFDSTQVITTSIVSPLQQQQMTLQTQIMSLATEAKDLRKRASKEESELSRKMQDLKEKYMQLQSKYSVSENCLDIAKKQLEEIREKYDEKIFNIQSEHQKIIKENKKCTEELKEQLDNKQKTISLLQSELHKQKLLHQQTKQFYDQTVQLLKSREAEALTELEEISLSASREMNVMRTISTKQIGDFQTNTDELLRKVSNQEQLLIERDEAIEKMKKELQFMHDRIIDFQEMTTKIHELELKNKILEEMENECELLRTKNRKLDDELKRVLKEKQLQNQLCQQSETKSLLISERHERLVKQKEVQSCKMRELATEVEQLKLQKLKIEEKLQKYTSKMMNDASLQVQDTSLKQKLLLALQTINELQSDYNKVKEEYDWHRRFRS